MTGQGTGVQYMLLSACREISSFFKYKNMLTYLFVVNSIIDNICDIRFTLGFAVPVQTFFSFR